MEIVVNKEERWHVELLISVSQQLENLTLTIRTSSSSTTHHGTTANTPTTFDNDLDLQSLSKVIESMCNLRRLRIYSEITGTFRIKSSSLEHLLFQGSLSLEECTCPRLKSMDISFELHEMKRGYIIFKQMSPSVEELTLRIDNNGTNGTSSTSTSTRMHSSRVDDFESELQKLSRELQKMMRLKKLLLLPTVRCSFLVKPESLGGVSAEDDFIKDIERHRITSAAIGTASQSFH